MWRLRVAVVGTILGTAYIIVFPFRVWRRARRDGLSLADTLKAMVEDAHEKAPPEMRAQFDAEVRAQFDPDRDEQHSN